jgi:bla regulator protein blaR1
MRIKLSSPRSRELLAVGIFGRSSLGNRIETLLKDGRQFSRHASATRVAASGLALLVFVIGGALAPRWVAFAQQPDRPSFEVVSVKPGDPNARGVTLLMQPGGRLTATNATLKMLIGLAYDVRDHQLVGGPSWLGADKFNIEAKADSSSTIPLGPEGAAQIRLMTQSLLADRFKLTVHRESKEEQVYELVVAKSGFKLKEAADTGKQARQGLRLGRGQWTGTAASITLLTTQLAQQLGRSVLDKTDLAGRYDFELKWTPEPSQGGGPFGGPPGPDAPPPPDPNGPSIFTAIQEQLGLRLESTKGPVDVLVIDHAEKPDAN